MIWQACKGETHIQPLAGRLLRLVESQEQVATLALVDSLQEQAVLEQLLEKSKPAYPLHTEDLHYLLKSPFRYPPLRWGSRFGTASQPSLFYAAINESSCLAESAYYRLLFWQSMSLAKPVKPRLRSKHTLFAVDFKTKYGINLTQPTFEHYQSELTSASSYAATQDLGSDMRLAGVEAVEYVSVRDTNGGACVALFNASLFKQREPLWQQQWTCEVTGAGVSFKQAGASQVTHFSQLDFLVDDQLSMPAV